MNFSMPSSSVLHYLLEFAQIVVPEKTLESPLDSKQIKLKSILKESMETIVDNSASYNRN